MKTKEQYIQLLSDFQSKRGNMYGINKIGIFGSVAKHTKRRSLCLIWN